MIIRLEHLVILNNKNRVQHVVLKLDQDSINNTYYIYRTTGQYSCKSIDQPVIIITFGKAKRSTAEQASLQFNGLLKNYLNKGYSRLSTLTSTQYDLLSEEEIRKLLGGSITDTFGVPKPMLCKLSDTCSSSVFEKDWYVSRKIDGTRCLMYYKDGAIHTASRGGKTYDPATLHLRNNEQLKSLFQMYPNIILDGELYKHDINFPLQRISGLCRLETWTEECGNLEYWIYDYISNEPFKDRYTTLMSFKDIFTEPNSKIKVVDHEFISGYYKIRRRHDLYVNEGFEGLIMRNPDKEYGINKRSAKYMIKMKERKSGEFTVIGIKEGLRPEDMCFILSTKNGKQFAAKPIGPAELRLEYLYNSGNFIGKKATCNFFYYSPDGIPLQPTFVHIRPDDE